MKHIKWLFVSSSSSSSLSVPTSTSTSTSTISTRRRTTTFQCTTTILYLFLGFCCMIYPTATTTRATAFLFRNKPRPILPLLFRGACTSTTTYSYHPCRYRRLLRSITTTTTTRRIQLQQPRSSPLSFAAANNNNDNTMSSCSRSVATTTTLNNNKNNLVIVLAGVTGVGKSDVAAYLCNNNNNNNNNDKGGNKGGIIVSADSVQAYCGVQIGANKPTLQERIETPHILIDVVEDSTENYNAADWRDDAIYTIQSLLLNQQNNNNDDENDEEDAEEYDSVDEVDGSSNYMSKVMDAQQQQKQQDEENRQRQQRRRKKLIQESITQARITKGYKQDESLVPVICGGTMMYLQWLVHGRPDALKPSIVAIQKAQKCITNFQRSNNDFVGAVKYVSSFGTIFATRVTTKLCGEDWYRLRRILEVAYTVQELEQEKEKEEQKGGSVSSPDTPTGKSDNQEEEEEDGTNKKKNSAAISSSIIEKQLYTGQRQGSLESLGYDVRCFFLCPDDRMKHTKIIDQRCEQMIIQGLLKETATLSVAGCLPEMAARAIGYRQVLDYFASRGGDDNSNSKKSDDTNEEEEDDNTTTGHHNRSRYEDEAVAFNSFLDDFTTATRRYAKKQMSWFRKDDEFLFVPVSLTMDKKERVKTTASAIQELCQLTREEYEKVRSDNDSVSAKTKQANESQGKGMKFYQFQRHILKPNTKELESAISEAIECINQMNAKRKRDHSEHLEK